jgi:hypothetical protein
MNLAVKATVVAGAGKCQLAAYIFGARFFTPFFNLSREWILAPQLKSPRW